MKSIHSIVLVFLFTMLSGSCFSQHQFGLRTGVAATTFSAKGDLLDNSNVTFSYSAGAFYDLPVSKFFSVQPEINYVRKGRNNETSALFTTTSTDFLLHYLQLPVLLQYRDARTEEKSGSFFYFNAGPYAGFVLKNQLRPSGSIQISDDNKPDWGATLGIGYQFPVCKKDIRFDLRYDLGLSKIANQPEDYRSKALNLTIGLVL
jgi:hypothetical protein